MYNLVRKVASKKTKAQDREECLRKIANNKSEHVKKCLNVVTQEFKKAYTAWVEDKTQMKVKRMHSDLFRLHAIHEAAMGWEHYDTHSVDELKRMLFYERYYAKAARKKAKITDDFDLQFCNVCDAIEERIAFLETRRRRRRRLMNRLLLYETHYSSGAEGYPPRAED